MDMRKALGSAKRVLATGQIIANFGTAPVTKDLSPNLTKQFSTYSANVRLPETRRQIRRQSQKDMDPVAALDKRSAKRLRKC